MLNDNFQFLVGEYGRPQKAQPVSAEEIARYHRILPPGLVDFWQDCGIGMWLQGKFQFCRPELYAPIVTRVLRGDAVFNPQRTHLYGFTAFGELWLWNEDYQRLTIDLPRLWASSPMTRKNWKPRAPDIAIHVPLSRLNQETTGDWREDIEGAPLMFDRARKLRGELEMGECYGFVPALQLGGAAKMENTRRVGALEHFGILAQADRVSLFDYAEGRQTFVRLLGED